MPEPKKPSERAIGLMASAPWILYGAASCFGSWLVASGGGLILCLLYLALMSLRGASIKLMDWIMLAFFVIAAAATVWLRWPVFSSYNAVLAWSCFAVAAWGSIGLGRPFTAAYAREEAPPEFWDHAVFIRLNFVMTLVWCGLMTVNAGIAMIGVIVGGLFGRVGLGFALPLLVLMGGFRFSSRFPPRYLARAGVQDAAVTAAGRA